MGYTVKVYIDPRYLPGISVMGIGSKGAPVCREEGCFAVESGDSKFLQIPVCLRRFIFFLNRNSQGLVVVGKGKTRYCIFILNFPNDV